MLERIMEVSTGVWILWGLGALGLLLKIMANTYMRRMTRASANLGETKCKKLRNMRQKYENRKGFGLCGGDEESYAECYVRSVRFLTRPMEFWNRSGTVLSLVVCGLMAGAYLYYGRAWRGSPDMYFFLANCIIVCACLLIGDHIFLINNKTEILKANIRGYLGRLPKPREESKPQVQPFLVKAERRSGETADAERKAERRPEELADVKRKAEEQKGGTPGETDASGQERESAASEETLNRFLAEFFSS